MPNLANSTLRLLRRLLGAPERGPGPHAGSPTVLDGNTAIAHTEVGICEVAGIGGSFPAGAAGLAWRLAQRRLRTNAFGASLGSHGAGDARGALAGAIGLAMAGTRATCFLSGQEIGRCEDLLKTAAARRLPLVLHMAGRGTGGTGAVLGNAQEGFHAAADAGCLALVAANVQEAVDFTLIARRVCEQALLPGVVAMDGPETALAVQDVRPASPRLIRDLLGDPDDPVPCTDPAQQQLFGEDRRRLPRWHDPDHPVMLGALLPAEAAGPGRAAAHAYLDAPIDDLIEAAMHRFGELTGRAHRSVSAHRLDDANLVLLAMGSAIETAEAAADRLREPAGGRDRLKVGVVGLRRLHPFPGAELVRLLGRGLRVCVLECADVPLAEDPPLLRQLRGALGRAGDNHERGVEVHPGYPSRASKNQPRLLSVIYGLGGEALRGGDLLRLCREADRLTRPRVYLGVDFAHAASDYPKRQVLLDQLRRAYPNLADLGLCERSPAAGATSDDLRPAGALTLAIEHRAGDDGTGLMTEAAALLHRIDGGGLRAHPALFDQPWGQTCVERITSASKALREPGNDCPVELCLRLTDQSIPTGGTAVTLAANGILLVQTTLPEERLWARLSEAERVCFKDGAGQLYVLPPADAEAGGHVQHGHGDATAHPDPIDDYRLGALCALLLQRGLMELTRRRLLGLRAEMLRHEVADVDARLRLFEAGLDAPRRVDIARLPRGSAQGRDTGMTADERTPALMVGGIGGAGGSREGYDSLPRFWDRVGVLYRNGDTAEIGPEPALALAAVPALSSAFRDLSPLRERLPMLDPDLCTGCGACWSACPESAIAALAITPKQLIDAGVAAPGADALRPLASKLAAGVARLCLSTEYAPGTAAELIDSAYAQLAAALPFPAERKQAMAEALGGMVEAVGPAPLVATDGLFRHPESECSGTGALLALSLNPDSCKACGLCIAVCTPGALRNERQGSRALREARRLRTAWERLPDTETAVVASAAALPEPGALAARLLGRGATRHLIGGDGSEPGSGARLALRLTVTTLAARQTAAAADLVAEIEDTRERITALVRDILAEALPAGDLDTLSERLRRVASRHADLGELLGRAGDTLDGAIDAGRLRRLVDLAQDLGDWAWRLKTGAHGLGRAGCGLVLSPAAAVGWAGAFPDNPFAGPVVLDWSGDGADLAAGLFEGQLRQATHDLVLLRKARLELERPADAARQWAGLDGLSWRDLDDRELACCPSLLLVGDTGSLGAGGLSSLYRVLGGDLPLRLLLLADLDLGLGPATGLGLPAAALQDAAIDLGLLALSRRDAYLAQCSIAAPGHLAACFEGAFAHRGPALLQLHAPSPGRHGFATDQTIERAHAAVTARVLPLFRYDPGADGVFGSRIDLGDNPDPGEPWAIGPDGQPITPAHWALGEARFAELFLPLNGPLSEAAQEPIPLLDYLALSVLERAKLTPFIETAANGAERRRLRVDDALVRVCIERNQAWRVLQELAGLITPFTARVQQEAQAAVAAERRAELAALTADYERRIQDLRADYEQELRRDIKDRLMVLAGYRSARGGASR